MSTKNTEEKETKRIDEIIKLGIEKADVWQYFSDRADKLCEQLWTIGTWLFGIISAVLALPFVAKFMTINAKWLVTVESCVLTIAVSIFGLSLCIYAYLAQNDIRAHIERNWSRANFIRTGHWKEINLSESKFKLHGLRALLVFEALAVIVFIAYITLAICQG